MNAMDEWKELLQASSKEMGIALTATQAEQFMTYMDLLLEWNEKMNLTTITEPRDVVLKHFADCLSIVPFLEIKENTKIIDVGTGAGFPGIPVKIACPHMSMLLLDSLQKRIGFLEAVMKKLMLTDVSCVHSRAEDAGQSPLYREQFDYCVSRAVANLAILAEYCLPFVKVGGRLIALKGPEAGKEVQEAQRAVAKLGGKIMSIHDVTIPFTDLSHKLIIIEKNKATPKQYPRKAGTISKSPLT